jgi:hypothetical protein
MVLCFSRGFTHFVLVFMPHWEAKEWSCWVICLSVNVCMCERCQVRWLTF